MFEIPGSRKGYYQWDMNQRLYILDSRCNEVHFCNERQATPLTCLVQTEAGKRYVEVPNILLQSSLPLIAFFYVKGEADGYTKQSYSIEIWERPKPDDYVYTETDVKTWESAVIYALEEAKESGAFKGDQGEKGEKGDTGEQGPQGEKGEKGEGILTKEEKLELSMCGSAEGKFMYLKDATKMPLAELQVFGKTTQDGTPTPDTPVELASPGTGGSISVTITGKNLLNFCPNIAGYKNRGITFDAQDGGTRLYGTSSDGYAQNKAEHYLPLTVSSGTYTLKMEVSGETDGARFCVRIVRDGATVVSAAGTVSGSATFTLEEGVSYGCFVYMEESGKTVDCVIRVMLAPGEESAQWEAHSAQVLSVSTPDGLPGIPVPTGGNYTDENGQQWICDEIDFVRGVYIKRIFRVELVGWETWTLVERNQKTGDQGVFVCALDIPADSMALMTRYVQVTQGTTKTIGAFDTKNSQIRINAGDYKKTLPEWRDQLKNWYYGGEPLVLYGIKTNPEEYALSAEELANYDALYTYKPNTTIKNDAGTWMKVSYALDAKTYIDNKFAELAAAITASAEGA